MQRYNLTQILLARINLFSPQAKSYFSNFLKNKKHFNRPYYLYQTIELIKILGGGERDRTDDPLLAKQVLSQLSYTPFSWWVWVDLNHRPHAYQACALTN